MNPAPIDVAAEVVDAGVGPAANGFAHLEAEAAALEGGPPIAGSAEAAQAEGAQLAQTAEELSQALGMARLMVRPMFGWWQGFDATWSDRTLQGIAAGGAAVMVKHGWTMGELFAEWGPYIALAGATLPPSLVTYGAIKQRKLEMIAAQRQAATRRPDDVQPGGAVDGGNSQATH